MGTLHRWISRGLCCPRTHYHDWPIEALCDSSLQVSGSWLPVLCLTNHKQFTSACTFVLALPQSRQKFKKCSLSRSALADWATILILFITFFNPLLLLYFWSKLISSLHQISHTFDCPFKFFIFLLFPEQVFVLLFVIQLPPAGYQISSASVVNFN